MTTGKLNNKIALITGGTTGIGLATAERYAAEGATVIVTGRNPDTLQQARTRLGERAEVIKSDAGDPADIAALFEAVKAKHGRVDVLFLNAGVARFAPLGEADVATFDTMWNVNVRGPWLALQAALPLLSEGGSVIFNTSIAGTKGFGGTGAYASTKAALRSLVRVFAAELAPRNIRVNAIAPGPIETPIYGKLGMPQAAVEEMGQGFVSQVPLARFGSADEIAQPAVFLASQAASFITGVELAVDGGLSQI